MFHTSRRPRNPCLSGQAVISALEIRIPQSKLPCQPLFVRLVAQLGKEPGFFQGAFFADDPAPVFVREPAAGGCERLAEFFRFWSVSQHNVHILAVHFAGECLLLVSPQTGFVHYQVGVFPWQPVQSAPVRRFSLVGDENVDIAVAGNVDAERLRADHAGVASEHATEAGIGPGHVVLRGRFSKAGTLHELVFQSGDPVRDSVRPQGEGVPAPEAYAGILRTEVVQDFVRHRDLRIVAQTERPACRILFRNAVQSLSSGHTSWRETLHHHGIAVIWQPAASGEEDPVRVLHSVHARVGLACCHPASDGDGQRFDGDFRVGRRSGQMAKGHDASVAIEHVSEVIQGGGVGVVIGHEWHPRCLWSDGYR